jgi:adenosylhomocysteine nucleosidase
MPMELAPLRRKLALKRTSHGSLVVHRGRLGDRPVVAIVTGMGTAPAGERVARLLDAVAIDRVVVVGITGGVDGETAIGTLILPECVVDAASGVRYRPERLGRGDPKGTMWTSDDLLTDPAAIAALRSDGVVSLDMETAAVARVCEGRGIPWSVFRCISDRATDGSVDQELFGLSSADGTPDAGAVVAYVAKHPGRIPGLVRMARQARLATQRAAALAVEAVVAGPV